MELKHALKELIIRKSSDPIAKKIIQDLHNEKQKEKEK